MTTYFAGGGRDCWSTAPAGVTDDANGVYVSGGYADAILVDNTNAPVNATTLWFHAQIQANDYDPGNGHVPIEFRTASAAVVARFRYDEAGYVFEWYDGTTWHSCPSINIPRSFANGVIDARVEIGASGRIEWYYNSNLAAQLLGNTSAMGSIASVRVYPVEQYLGSGYYSKAIAANYNTIGHTVSRRTITGNGAEQAWVGDASSVDEDVTDDTTALTSSTVGDVSTFTATTLAAPATGSVIKSVVFGIRARANGSSAPTRVQAVITIGGTDYDGPGVVPNGGFAGFTTAFDNDPSTSAPWATIGAVNNPIGVKAVA